jgi:YhcH/YjgK/YiaL family protein
MIVDSLKNWNFCTALPQLRRAFEVLASQDVSTWPDGRVELDGDRMFALPQGYLTRPAAQCRWEAHRRCIDIQYIISGREAMGYAPLSTLKPVTAFDETKDVGFYDGTGSIITVEAGMFAIFFPHDAHMPCMQVAGHPESVRKVVVKVAMQP